MTIERPSVSDLACRLRHIGGEFRDLRRIEYASSVELSLYFRLSATLVHAVHSKALPEAILSAVVSEQTPLGPSFSKYFWELALSNAVLGYSESDFDVYTNPEEYDDENMCCWGGERVVILTPGFVAKAWPQVFDVIHSHALKADEDPEQVANELSKEKRFEILGYRAQSCELLADWIESHANDDHDDRILPGDGLQCGDTVFVWGGKPYSITPNIADALKVLMKAYRDGRDAIGPEFETALGEETMKNGFGSLFRVGKSPNKSIHPVRFLINPLPNKGGRSKYRLIDPAELN